MHRMMSIKSLAEEYAESVVEDGGVTCCHHTCGNSLLNNYVSGLVSVPGLSKRLKRLRRNLLSRKGLKSIGAAMGTRRVLPKLNQDCQIKHRRTGQQPDPFRILMQDMVWDSLNPA